MRPWAAFIAAAAVWLVMQPLLALGQLHVRNIGLVPPRPGSLLPAMWRHRSLALAFNATHPHFARRDPVDVTPAPGARDHRSRSSRNWSCAAFCCRWRIKRSRRAGRWRAAASVPAGLIVTFAFVALHGARPGVLLGVAPAALLYLWLRARTGSLVAPIVAHVLWNRLGDALHR